MEMGDSSDGDFHLSSRARSPGPLFTFSPLGAGLTTDWMGDILGGSSGYFVAAPLLLMRTQNQTTSSRRKNQAGDCMLCHCI